MQILVVGSETHVCNATECIIAVQGHSGSTNVVDFGTSRKRVYDFLLVINSNLCRNSHRFGDTATWSKIAKNVVPTPPSFNAIARGDPLRILG